MRMKGGGLVVDVSVEESCGNCNDGELLTIHPMELNMCCGETSTVQLQQLRYMCSCQMGQLIHDDTRVYVLHNSVRVPLPALTTPHGFSIHTGVSEIREALRRLQQPTYDDPPTAYSKWRIDFPFLPAAFRWSEVWMHVHRARVA